MAQVRASCVRQQLVVTVLLSWVALSCSKKVTIQNLVRTTPSSLSSARGSMFVPCSYYCTV